MMTIRTTGQMMALLCVLLMLSACTSAQVVSSLEAAVTAAGTVLPLILNAENVPPATVVLIAPFESAALACLNVVGTVTVAGGKATLIAAQIAAACAKIVAPVLPPNTPPLVISAVNGLATALTALLGYFGVTFNNAALSARFSMNAPKLSQIGGNFSYRSGEKLRALDATAKVQAMQIQLARH